MSSNQPHAWNPPSVFLPNPTYSQVCTTPILPNAKYITVAGQVGIDPSTNKVAEAFIPQVKLAYANIHSCLKAAGATPRDITFVRHYIVKETGDPELDGRDVLERGWGEIWMQFLDREAQGHRPPDTVLGVAALASKELLYEVEVVAVVNKEG